MFIVGDPFAGIILIMIGMLLSGLWPLPMKWIGKTAPSIPIVFFDLGLGFFTYDVIACLTWGNYGEVRPTFFENLSTFDAKYVILPILSGMCQSMGNHLIVQIEAMIGLTLAFPVGVGTSLVFGTTLTYLVNPRGNPYFLFAGVFSAIVAVLLGSASGKVKEMQAVIVKNPYNEGQSLLHENEEDDDYYARPIKLSSIAPQSDAKPYKAEQKELVKGMILCIFCGTFWSIWQPLALFGQMTVVDGQGTNPAKFAPYNTLFFICIGHLIGIFAFGTYLLYFPLSANQPKDSITSYFELNFYQHALPFISGSMIGCLQWLNIIAGEAAGFAISFAIMATNPIVTASIGIFVYKELTGTTTLFKTLYLMMCAGYILAIILIALASLVEGGSNVDG